MFLKFGTTEIEIGTTVSSKKYWSDLFETTRNYYT